MGCWTHFKISQTNYNWNKDCFVDRETLSYTFIRINWACFVELSRFDFSEFFTILVHWLLQWRNTFNWKISVKEKPWKNNFKRVRRVPWTWTDCTEKEHEIMTAHRLHPTTYLPTQIWDMYRLNIESVNLLDDIGYLLWKKGGNTNAANWDAEWTRFLTNFRMKNIIKVKNVTYACLEYINLI